MKQKLHVLCLTAAMEGTNAGTCPAMLASTGKLAQFCSFCPRWLTCSCQTAQHPSRGQGTLLISVKTQTFGPSSRLQW